MEEKLKNRNTRKMIYAIVGVLLVVTAIVLIILFLLNGRTTIGDTTKTNVTAESLSCESDDAEYPIFSYDDSDRKNIKINMLFGEKKLDTLSFVYRLYYTDNDKIVSSEAVNHADMNKSFSKDGLSPDAFGANYALLSDSMQMTLNANKKQIDGVSSKYFLLEGVNNYSKDSLKNHFESKGFKCKDNK